MINLKLAIYEEYSCFYVVFSKKEASLAIYHKDGIRLIPLSDVITFEVLPLKKEGKV